MGVLICRRSCARGQLKIATLAVAYGDGLELDVSLLRARGVEEFAVRSGAASVYALDLLVDGFVAATGDTAEELLDRLDDAGPANDDDGPFGDIVSPLRWLARPCRVHPSRRGRDAAWQPAQHLA